MDPTLSKKGKWIYKYKWVLLVCFIVVFGVTFTFIYKEFSTARTPESAFNKGMKGYDSYKILDKINDKNHELIFFTGYNKLASAHSNNLIQLGYLGRENDSWSWIKTGTCDPKWSETGSSTPYIYCGLIPEPKYSKIMIGSKEAKMIKLKDGKRIWYYIGKKKDQNDLKIKAVLTDGTEKWLKKG